MIRSTDRIGEWFDDDSARRSTILETESARLTTWLQIVEDCPRARYAVSLNPTVPMEVLERLRVISDFATQSAIRGLQRWNEHHPDDGPDGGLDLDELVNYELTALERRVLSRGLLEWGGSARPTDELAVAMGFTSVADLHLEGDRISSVIEAGRPLTHNDWARTLISTEIAFMSYPLGAAMDWEVLTGISDIDTFHVIRGLQVYLRVKPLARQAPTAPLTLGEQ